MNFSGISYADYPDTKKNRPLSKIEKERFIVCGILINRLPR